MGNAVAKRILLLIEHDGMMVSELSTGEEMPVRTITCLWQFLAGKLEEDVSPDFLSTCTGNSNCWRSRRKSFRPFACQTADEPLADRAGRGGDGDPSLQQGADHCRLIRKIERRHAPTSRFQFTEGMSYAEKYVKVQEWWNTGRFHLAMAFKKPDGTELFPWRFPVGWNDGPVGTCS